MGVKMLRLLIVFVVFCSSVFCEELFCLNNSLIDNARKAFFQGNDQEARKLLIENGEEWTESFLYIIDGGPFKHDSNLEMIQGLTPSGKYILYSDAGIKKYRNPESGEKLEHTPEWFAIAKALDLINKEFERVICKPNNDGFIGRVFYFTNEKKSKEFLKSIGAPSGIYTGIMSSIHYTVFVLDTKKIDANSREEKFPTLFHEATHQYLWRLIESPTHWFDEGLATFFKRYRVDLVNNKLIYDRRFDKELDTRIDWLMICYRSGRPQYLNEIPDLMKMDSDKFYFTKDKFTNQENQYAQSCAIMRYFLEPEGNKKYLESIGGGKKIFDSLLLEFRKGSSKEQVYNKIFGKNPEIDQKKLWEEWLNYVNNGFN